jgi:hypothetical protein
MFAPCRRRRFFHRQPDNLASLILTAFHPTVFDSPFGFFPSSLATRWRADSLPAQGGVSVMAKLPLLTIHFRLSVSPKA